MATMIARFRVTDFDRWKAVYDGMAAARREYGIASANVHRDAMSSKLVVTILSAGTVGDLRRWGASEVLRSAMAEAGVEGIPEVQFLEDVD